MTWDTSGAAAAEVRFPEGQGGYARAGQDGKSMEAYKRGDAAQAFGNGGKVIEATYWSEHTYHAQIGADELHGARQPGGTCDIWTGSQGRPALSRSPAAS